MSKTDVNYIAERIEKVKEEVAAKAATDGDFRDALIANPAAAIAEEYGLGKDSFLKQVKFRVVEAGEKEIVFVIPPAVKEAELTDEQLEMVAGGFAFTIAMTGAVVGGIATGVAAVGATAGIVQNSRAGRHW